MAILITGASAGFGAAMCRRLAQAGLPVIGVARREEKLQSLKEELGDSFQYLVMDMRDKAGIDAGLSQLATLPEDFQTIDCLINNAGLALGLDKAHEADFADWETMIQTNIIGLTYLTHQILPKMVENQKGYVINLGSIAGTYAYPGGNVYGATKAYVRQFSLNLRADLHGTGVRVTNIEPGLCGGSEFSNVRFKGDDERATKLYENVAAITPEDIAETVFWLYHTPAHMNVNTLELMPVAQSFGALPVHRVEPPKPEPTEEPVETVVPEVESSLFGKIASLFK